MRWRIWTTRRQRALDEARHRIAAEQDRARRDILRLAATLPPAPGRRGRARS